MIRRFDDEWDYDLIDGLLPNDKTSVIIQIERLIAGHTRIEHAYCKSEDFVEWLNNFVQGSDCKNGCSMDDDPADMKFIIEGRNWYNELLGISGTDSVTIRVRKASFEPAWLPDTDMYDRAQLRTCWEQSDK